jgi:hypothetical protein
MAEIKVLVDDGHRARNIVIGVAVVFVLSYWQFTGTLPFVAEAVVPKPTDDKLSSAWSIGTSLLGDLFYFVGVITTTVVSGAWSLAVSLIGSLLNRNNSAPEPVAPVAGYVTKSDLDTIASQILQTVQGPLNDLADRITDLEQPAPKAAPKAVRRKSTP